jgi:TrwC relaxase
MTAIAITGMGLTGVLRLTWVQDNLAHVLDYSQADETSGTWTGLACPRRGLALGTDVDNATLEQLAAGSELADLTWEAPDELTAGHTETFLAAMRAYHGGDAERAGQLWENLRAIWSQAWSANYAMLEFMQGTGLARFSPVKPQHWVVASFEHHTSPHGLPRPHVHNIVITS